MDVRNVKVKLWGTVVGYLYKQNNGLIGFQYNENFLNSGIEIAPIKMPLSAVTYSFPALPEETFKGLPGLVADSLPDKFGNIVIERYLESIGRTDSLTALEKLCHTGQRGMGALEYEPSADIADVNKDVDIDALTKLASDILSERESVNIKHDNDMVAQLMQCSSSVGGARAKTLIAWNPETNAIKSGQINAGKGFEYWLLKFGDISNNKDKDAKPDSGEYTNVEYAYYLMAKAAGINMSECRLYKGNGKSHFMTKRFDRTGVNGDKLHMQSLCALAHMDFNSPRVYSYEDAFKIMSKLKLSHEDFIQLYRRMVFNEYAKNFDDHTKNISFLMNKSGKWSLSPAYDITFSYNKSSVWVSAHQMLINGKADEITKDDMLAVAHSAEIGCSEAVECIEQVQTAVSRWSDFAEESELSSAKAERIRKEIS